MFSSLPAISWFDNLPPCFRCSGVKLTETRRSPRALACRTCSCCSGVYSTLLTYASNLPAPVQDPARGDGLHVREFHIFSLFDVADRRLIRNACFLRQCVPSEPFRFPSLPDSRGNTGRTVCGRYRLWRKVIHRRFPNPHPSTLLVSQPPIDMLPFFLAISTISVHCFVLPRTLSLGRPYHRILRKQR